MVLWWKKNANCAAHFRNEAGILVAYIHIINVLGPCYTHVQNVGHQGFKG
jgi:hypothetical protein